MSERDIWNMGPEERADSDAYLRDLVRRTYAPLSIRSSRLATFAWRYLPGVNYGRGRWLARRLP